MQIQEDALFAKVGRLVLLTEALQQANTDLERASAGQLARIAELERALTLELSIDSTAPTTDEEAPPAPAPQPPQPPLHDQPQHG